MYENRKDVKEYLNFYLQPDSKALAEKCIKPIIKEFQRIKYGESKARITKISSAIKYFESFSPDSEYVREFYFQTILIALNANRYYWFADRLIIGLGERVVKRYLEMCDKNFILDQSVKRLLDGAEPLKNVSGLAREIGNVIYNYLDEKAL